MGNKIHFADSGQGPMQEDEVIESQTVKFYCNVEFDIVFKSASVNGHWDPDLGDQPVNLDPVTFRSNVHGNKHRIKIKFVDIPNDGFAYTVETPHGNLDPRVVPPR